MLYLDLSETPKILLLLAIAFFRGSLIDALDGVITHVINSGLPHTGLSYFPIYVALLIKFDVITSSNPILVNRDVMSM